MLPSNPSKLENNFTFTRPGICSYILRINTKETENGWHVQTQNAIEIEMRHPNESETAQE